jgi:hypothetical protein
MFNLSMLLRFLPVLLWAAFLSTSRADDTAVWQRVDLKPKLEKQHIEGRGKDVVEWTTNVSPAALPEQLKVGDTVSLNVSVDYRYGAGKDGKNKGRPKTLTISISIPGGSEKREWDLVPNYCGAKPKEKPMAPSGSLSLSATGRITKEHLKSKTLSVGVVVGVSEYCWHNEAGGSSGIRATYRMQGPPPVATPNQAPRLRLTVNDPDRILFTGQRTRFTARVKDDRDRADQLTFRWQRIDRDSGRLVKTLGPTRKRRVVWTPDTPGKYRIRVEATDRDGAKGGPASLDVEVVEPEIEGIKLSKGTRAKHRVKDYWDQGLKWAVRRGNWAALLIDVKHYHPRHHRIGIYVDGQRIRKGKPNDRTWVAQNGGGNDARRRILVFIPPQAAVGPYQVEVSLERRRDNREVARKALPPELLVLFNPFPSTLPDPSVHAGKPLDLATANAYALGTQDFDYGRTWTTLTGHRIVGLPSPYDVTPHDPRTLTLAKDLLSGLSESDRRSAAKVAKHFADAMRSIVEGRWTDTYPAGKAPWDWDAAGKVCGHYTVGGIVQYGQCFTFGMALNGLLRSVGIPNRMVSVWGSGHDQQRRWGVLERIWACRAWTGTNCNQWVEVKRDDHDPSQVHLPPPGPGLERWGFHLWNELWIPRVNRASGWALADGTYSLGTPSRAAVRRLRHQPLGHRYNESDPATFVFTEVNLPFQELTQVSNGSFYRLDCVDRTAYHAFVADPAGNRQDILTAAYAVTPPAFCATTPTTPPLRLVGGKSETGASTLAGRLAALNPLPSAHAAGAPRLYLEGPARTPLGNDLSVTLRADGSGGEPMALAAMLFYLPPEFSGGADRGGPQVRFFQELTLAPGGQTALHIPGDALDRVGRYRLRVGGPAERAGPTAGLDFIVQGLDLTLELPERAALGDSVPLRVHARNPLARRLDAVRIDLNLPKALTVKGPPSAGPRSLAPGTELMLETELQAGAAGHFVIQAMADSPAGPAYANAAIDVSGPPTLSIDAPPQVDVPPNRATGVEVTLINEGLEPLSGLSVHLGSAPGIEPIGPVTHRQAELEAGGSWMPEWQVRAAKPGAYRVPVIAEAAGGIRSEAELLILVGGDDPDDFETEDPDQDYDEAGNPVAPESSDTGAAPEASEAGGDLDGEGVESDLPGPGPDADAGDRGAGPAAGTGTAAGAGTGPIATGTTGAVPVAGAEREPNDRFSKANSIRPDTDLSGTIHPRRDIDWYRLEVGHHGQLEIDIDQVAAPLDIVLRAWNADKDPISHVFKPAAEGAGTSGVVDLPRPGPYWVEVRDNYDNGESTHPYRMRTRFTPSADQQEPNDRFGSAAAISTAADFPATILPRGDVDWYRLDVEQHGQLRVWIEDVVDPLDIVVRVRNADKDPLTGYFKPSAKGAPTEVLADLPAPGRWWLEVRDNYDDARAIEPYRLRSELTPSKDRFEPNDSFSQAVEMAPSGTLQATILPRGDVDWYVLEVPHQGELRLALSEVAEPLDLIVRVWTKDKSPLTGYFKPAGKGKDNHALVDLPEAGRYWLEVRDNYDNARAIEPYRLTSRFQATVDTREPNNRFGSAAPLALASPAQATILPRGDVDWYDLGVMEKGRVLVQIDGVAPELDIVARIRNADKAPVGGYLKPPGKGAETIGSVELREAGRYYLEVRDNYDNARALQPYRVRVDWEPAGEGKE